MKEIAPAFQGHRKVSQALSNSLQARSFSPKSASASTEFRKNDNVFKQGDVANTVFYLQNGNVKLTVVSDHGKEAVVGILKAGQFFGEGCMNGLDKNECLSSQ